MRLLSKFKTMKFRMKILTAGSCLRIVVCSFFFLVCSNTAYSKAFFFFSWGTEVYIVQKMPDDYMIQTTEHGEIHANLGVAYNEFSFFGIPLWNWNVETYILLPDNYNSKGMYIFYNIDTEEFRRIQQIIGNLPEKPKLSFWRRFGGKLIFLPFILSFLCEFISSLTKTEENNNKTSKQ